MNAVHRLHPRVVPDPQPVRPSPMVGETGDVNDTSRRVVLQQTVAAMVAHEPKWAGTDGERLALLTERVGEVAAAFNRAHTDIDGEVLKVMATAQAWLEARSREAAR